MTSFREQFKRCKANKRTVLGYTYSAISFHEGIIGITAYWCDVFGCPCSSSTCYGIRKGYWNTSEIKMP